MDVMLIDVVLMIVYHWYLIVEIVEVLVDVKIYDEELIKKICQQRFEYHVLVFVDEETYRSIQNDRVDRIVGVEKDENDVHSVKNDRKKSLYVKISLHEEILRVV